MKILFYFGHPAQYLFLRETMIRLKKKGVNIKILIKTKDVLEELLSKDGFEYTNILLQERGKSKILIALSLLKRELKILPIIIKYKPDILISTDAPFAQLGKLLGIHRITITEDDYEVIKTLGKLTYPFTEIILCPEVCEVGKWGHKKVGYSGYMKLGYLHPNVFSKDKTIIKKYNFSDKYVIIRLAKLTAHHDFGIKGIDSTFVLRIIATFEKQSYRVYISAEGEIEEQFDKYLLQINSNEMHQVLASASFLICDSQSMSVEAAMLGVPSIRFSSFAGRISVLEELEHKYQLTFGIKPDKPELLFNKIKELFELPNLKEEFQDRRKKMLKDKIDVTTFMVWLIENYPESVKIMKENPDYQYRFK